MLWTLWISAAIACVAALLAWTIRRFGRRRWPRASAVAGLLMAMGAAVVFAFSLNLAAFWAAGQPGPIERRLADGVVYHRYVLTEPNVAVVHVLEITRPDERQVVVSPPVETADGPRNIAGYAATAMEAMEADVVINGNFFRPFHDYGVLDYTPHYGDAIEPIGRVIGGGVRYGFEKPEWPSFWQTGDGRFGFGKVPANSSACVTGRQYLVRDGKPCVEKDEPPYPRSAIAFDATHSRLWLVIVDGKQPRWSEGLSLSAEATFLASLGAAEAIELDGGGSAIMVFHGKYGPERLSRPCHTQIPGRQRPTGVFLGVRFSGRP